VFYRQTSLDLKLRILGSTETQPPRALHKRGGNEPAPTVSNENK
jgi:hypothetical protein